MKDDKFRLIGTTQNHNNLTVNLARILECRYTGAYDEREYAPVPAQKEELELLLIDERNALERCMMHFSDFEKVTEKIGERQYRFRIRYEKQDEREVLIRVLSFGPKLEVIGPEAFREQIRRRLRKQMNLIDCPAPESETIDPSIQNGSEQNLSQ